jgi:hypothetical protein
MTCFYCFGDVHDEAIACRHCGRDIAVIRPFEQRLAKLERRVDAITEAIAELGAVSDLSLASVTAESVTSRVPGQLIIPLTIAIAASIWSYHVFRLNIAGNQIWLAASIGMPLPFGLWSGIWWRGKHVRSYLIGGALGGIVELVGVILRAQIVTSLSDLADWTALYVVGIYVGGAALLFTAGALFGDLIEQYLLREPSGSRVARSIAARILKLEGREPTGDQLSRMATIIGTITPILTLIGSIITAYLTYRAAVVAK